MSPVERSGILCGPHPRQWNEPKPVPSRPTTISLTFFAPHESRGASELLDGWFSASPGVAVALSGGVDSALVAYWARRTLGRDRCSAWTGVSPSLKQSDLETARTFCRTHDIPHQLVHTAETTDPEYVRNGPDRCFHCKQSLYRTLISYLRSEHQAVWICSGANLDDLADYRPGLQAAKGASVRHPLLECGIGKAAVRSLAKAHGLHVWDKPASPCLSSRIPYGHAVTHQKLAQIEAAESWLDSKGFAQSRVRHFGDLARVEVTPGQIPELTRIWDAACMALIDCGFKRAEIDREGLVSGKLNRSLKQADHFS